jgi:TerB-C domain
VTGFYMAAEVPECAGRFSSIASQVQEIARQYEPISQAAKEFTEQSASLKRVAQEAAEESASLRRIAQEAAEQTASIRRMAEEFEQHYEPIRREGALAAEELRKAQSAISGVDAVHMRHLRASMQAFAEGWRSEHLESLVKPVHLDLGIAKVNMHLFERFDTEVLAGFRNVDWSSIARMTPTISAAVRALAAVPIEVAGAGVVAVPNPSMSGAGEVVIPAGTNAWPAIAEQLQRIGALPCGQVYAIVFFLVLIVLLPKLAEEIGDAALFVTVTNAIMRNRNG